VLEPPADYDNDHKADLAVYSGVNCTWIIDFSRDGFTGLNAIIQEMP